MLQDAWKRGSLAALWEIGKLYEVGGHGYQAIDADAAKSLAFTWLYVKLNEAAFVQHETPSDFVSAISRVLERRMEAVPTEQQSPIIAQAKDILRANANCCFVP